MIKQSASSEVPAAAAQLKRLSQFLEEIAQLVHSPVPPAEFYAEFLKCVLAAIRGSAGAVWTCTPQGNLELEYQINTAAVGLDTFANGRACHAELLRLAVQRDQPMWVPPHSGPDLSEGKVSGANLTAYGLLLVPFLENQTVAGLVEVWQDCQDDPQGWRASARLLGEAAGYMAAYLQKNRFHQLQDQQLLWTQLEAYVRQIHGSLEPRAVACVAANQSRQLLNCDQVSVALRLRGAVQVAAVSGATEVAARSRLIERMRALFEVVLAWGERLVFRGARDETLPPRVRAALDAYLVESNSRFLIVLPLRDERDRKDVPCRSALLAECFEPGDSTEHLEDRLTVLAQYTTPALYNAVEHTRLPLGRLSRALAAARDRLHGRGWVKGILWTAALMLPIGLLTVIPAQLRLSAQGQLLPQERQIVFAPLSGKIVEMKVQHGDQVERGQELLFLEDLETQLKVEQLGIQIGSAEHRLALLNDQLGKAVSDEECDTFLKERIGQEYELRKAMAERAILLQESRNPRKTPVTAPLAGKVVTFDVREQLVGKTVKPGDLLVRIASCRGPWEIELLIPERHLGPIREALHGSPEGALEVDLLLTNQPHRTYKGRLSREGMGGETTVKKDAVVLPTRISITDSDLLAQLENMPVGVEVRAKVHCGHHALGHVWFYDLWEFFCEHVLF